MASDPTHFLSGRRIVVGGAGLAGLSFVISLFKFWDAAIPPPEIVLVEADSRDESINRWPYELQLSGEHDDSPLVGFQEQGLLDAVLTSAAVRANPDAAMHIWDKAWKSLIAFKPKTREGMPTSSVRISRAALLALMIAAVEANTKITWATSVHGVERLPDGTVRVSLLDKVSGAVSEEVVCDLLVAADGDESAIRKAMRPDDVSANTGHITIGGFVDFGDKASIPAPLADDFGIVVGGDGVAAVVAHVNHDGRLVWSVVKEEKKTPPRDAYDNTDAAAFAALMEEARAAAKNIGAPLADLIDRTEQGTSFARPPREREPFGHANAPELRGVIFVGEANRLVSSYAGSGGALALRDGIELARALIGGGSLEEATAAYDTTALARSNRAMKQARDTMNTAHLSGWKWTITKTALSTGGFLTGNK